MALTHPTFFNLDLKLAIWGNQSEEKKVGLAFMYGLQAAQQWRREINEVWERDESMEQKTSPQLVPSNASCGKGVTAHEYTSETFRQRFLTHGHLRKTLFLFSNS